MVRDFIAHTSIIFRCTLDKMSFIKYLSLIFALTYITYPSFGVYETSCVSYKLKMRTWSSSTTKRDQLFLKLLGVNDREGMVNL